MMNAGKAVLSLSLLGALAVTPAAYAGSGTSESGQTLYAQNCAMCHGSDGKGGVPGAPDFTKPGGVLTQSDAVLAQRILNGFSSKGSPMAMPPMKGQVSPAQVHEILEYMHKAFGVAPAKRSGGA